MNIDRCYCFQVRFSRLKRIAKETGAESISELQDHILFGAQCQLCHPYVRNMLQTGTTMFHETISDPEDASSQTKPLNGP